jgi:hypothetical protein
MREMSYYISIIYLLFIGGQMSNLSKTVNNGQVLTNTKYFIQTLSDKSEYGKLKKSIIDKVRQRYISSDTVISMKKLLVKLSLEKIKKVGNKYNVTFIDRSWGKSKDIQSYYICGKNMSKGYGYVEGVIVHKFTQMVLPWSWNVDKDGNHVDFTKDFTDDWDYYGIVIPNDIVYSVDYKNGGTWYCVLPFVEITNEKSLKYKDELVEQLPNYHDNMYDVFC